jgi:hypothetical protein
VNFHDRKTGIAAEADGVRYLPVAPHENPPPKRRNERLAALATSPLLGSRLLFPRSFDRAFARVRDGGAVRAVTPEHAAFFFGKAVRLDLDPFSLKRRISDWVRHPEGVHWVGVAFLDAADWSDAISDVAGSPIHKETLEIVAAGADFRDTNAYRTMIQAIEAGRPPKRNKVTLVTAADVDAYFHYCNDIIDNIRARGFVRLAESGPFHRMRIKHRDVRPVLHDATELDVGVAITEDGEIIRHLGGKHRTAIAMALKLKTMPVEIRMVHARWLARQVERTGLPPHRALVEGVRDLLARH